MESQTQIRARMKKVIRRLHGEYPDSQCSLSYKTPHELLVATILSAQCTDERVNLVTPGVFKKYPSVKEFAYCDLKILSKDIHSCGYHNQKAKAIKGSSLTIWEEYSGEVPDSMEELIELPGVGRKTANCILGTAFKIPSVVVDTHMVRIIGLLGFTKSNNPTTIELEMMDIVLEGEWIDLTHLVIDHGRKVCIARRPKCSQCVLSDLCPSSLN